MAVITELAGAGVNNAGEEQAFQRGEAQPGGIESEGECHRKVADDDGETVFDASPTVAARSGKAQVKGAGFSI